MRAGGRAVVSGLPDLVDVEPVIARSKSGDVAADQKSVLVFQQLQGAANRFWKSTNFQT